MKRQQMHRHDHLPDHTEQQRREQSEQRWNDLFNGTLGMLGLPIGIACLTTKTPSVNAALGLIFLIIVWGTGRRCMPKHLLKHNQSESARIKVSFRQRCKNRWKFWTGMGPGIIGYVYLCFVMSSQPISASCQRNHSCDWFVHLVDSYVGAPK